VREYATAFEIRPELRFNDLRGAKVTEMVWAGISVPDLAIRIGWKIETAAKMLGVYAALSPGRAMMVALPSVLNLKFDASGRCGSMSLASDGRDMDGRSARCTRDSPERE
jgi:hypothetical protein